MPTGVAYVDTKIASEQVVLQASSGTFTDAGQRAFNLAGTGRDRSQTIGDRHAQIIMAMHADDGLPDILHVLEEVFD